jgi:hypothetical protein
VCVFYLRGGGGVRRSGGGLGCKWVVVVGRIGTDGGGGGGQPVGSAVAPYGFFCFRKTSLSRAI